MVQEIADRLADTVMLAGQTVERSTLQGLKAASSKSGVSFQYLLAKAAQESSLNPDAQAETSSAAGLFQFTRGTWLEMFRRYGSQYGYGSLARQILETPSGKLTVTDAETESKIMALRQDPEASGLMAAAYARDNAATLEQNLGREPDAADLYLAHFLGANGAASFLNATPDRSAAALVPAAAKANPSVFTTAGGEPRSAGDVVKLVRDRFISQLDRFQTADADTVASDAPAAAAAQAQPSSPERFDLRAALAGGSASPEAMMMMDELLHVIASDPMVPADEEDDSGDPLRRLSSGALHGSDFADAMSASLIPSPQPPAASRAYAPGPGAGRKLNDVI